MKIEKLSDNQIRCTLTRADLAARQLQLSELAYGTEKAKSLFRDMMQQAAFEFGFEADDIPLMIEAIPASSDSIVLIITKVEDPEELDTRFSKFAPASGGDADFQKNQPIKLEGADSLLELLDKVKEKMASREKEKTSDNEKKASGKPALRWVQGGDLRRVRLRRRGKAHVKGVLQLLELAAAQGAQAHVLAAVAGAALDHVVHQIQQGPVVRRREKGDHPGCGEHHQLR